MSQLLPTALDTASALALTIAVAFLVSVVVHRVLVAVLATTARRKLAGQRTWLRWRLRLSRSHELAMEGEGVPVGETRRAHRIDAAARALSRLAAVLIHATALLIFFESRNVSITAVLGSAGFLGLILALGAQTSVGDWVTGVHILLEDRFGEGDTIRLTTANGRELEGVVTGLGMFGTRLESADAVHHVANRHLNEVTNLSQLTHQHGFASSPTRSSND